MNEPTRYEKQTRKLVWLTLLIVSVTFVGVCCIHLEQIVDFWMEWLRYW